MTKLLLGAQAIRRTGSAALNLCYVACGRFDAYWARETKAWDVAGGALLIQEAGGIVTNFDGGPISLENHATSLLQHQRCMRNSWELCETKLSLEKSALVKCQLARVAKVLAIVN